MTKVKRITPMQRFAAEFGLEMNQVLHLRSFADRVAKTGERETGSGTKSVKQAAAQAQQDFLEYAKACGFDDYDMPGLYPTLTKGDRQYIDIPGD